MTIPGGSGAGNAVEHLSLPETYPEFFKFAAFDRQPLQAQPVNHPAPETIQQSRPAPRFKQSRLEPQPTQQFRPVPQTSQQFKPTPQPAQQIRPAPQPVQQFRPAPKPAQQFRTAPQPSEQLMPAPQAAPFQVQSQFSQQTIVGSAHQGAIPASTHQLQVFDSEPAQRRPVQQPTQQFRPARQPTQQFRSSPQPTRQFRPAPQPAQKSRPTPRQQARPAQIAAPVAARNYVHDTSGDNQLSRFQLFQLRKKKGQQQNQLPAVQETVSNEVNYL